MVCVWCVCGSEPVDLFVCVGFCVMVSPHPGYCLHVNSKLSRDKWFCQTFENHLVIGNLESKEENPK